MSSLMSATSSTVVNKAQWKNILVVGGEYLAVPHPQIFKDSDVKEQARMNLAHLVSLRRCCPCLEVQCMTDQAQAPSLATRS